MLLNFAQHQKWPSLLPIIRQRFVAERVYIKSRPFATANRCSSNDSTSEAASEATTLTSKQLRKLRNQRYYLTHRDKLSAWKKNYVSKPGIAEAKRVYASNYYAENRDLIMIKRSHKYRTDKDYRDLIESTYQQHRPEIVELKHEQWHADYLKRKAQAIRYLASNQGNKKLEWRTHVPYMSKEKERRMCASCGHTRVLKLSWVRKDDPTKHDCSPCFMKDLDRATPINVDISKYGGLR